MRIITKIALLALLLPAVCFAQGQTSASQSNPYGGNLIASTTNCTVQQACAWMKLPANSSSISVTLAGTFSATLVAEQSGDGGNTWSTVATLSAVGLTSYSVAAMTDFRVRCSAFTSGTVSVNLQAAGFAGSGASTTTNNVFTGTNTFQGPLQPRNIDGIRFADNFPGAPDYGVQINNASADCGSFCLIYADTPGTITTCPAPANGTRIVFGPGFWALPTACVFPNSLSIVCQSWATLLRPSFATGDVYTFNGINSEVRGCQFNPSVTRTGGYAIRVQNTGFVGDTLDIIDMYGGFFFTNNGSISAGSGAILNGIKFDTGGVTWHNFIRVYGSSTSPGGTVNGYNFSNIGGFVAAQDAPLLDFDSRLDTLYMVNVNIGNAVTGTNPCIRFHDTDAVGGFPRWVHLVNVTCEEIGTTAIDDVSGHDIVISNGNISSSTVGIAIGATANGTFIYGNQFATIAQNAITLASGAVGTDIYGNGFEDISQTTTNTYSLLNVSAGASNWVFGPGNYYKANNATVAKYGVDVAAGASDNFSIIGNPALLGSALGTGITDAVANATGTHFSVAFNGAQQAISNGVPCANGNLALSAGWGTTAAATAAAGTGQTCQWTITASGTGQAANPTITWTLPNALPNALTVCTGQVSGGTQATPSTINNTTLSATAPIFTYNGTPTAAATLFVTLRCGP